MPVPCGDDRPQPGRSVGLVLTSHGAYARGPLLRGGPRMDQQRDSVWIEPLEATALSDDEETQTQTQTTVSIEGTMNCIRQELIFGAMSAGGDAGGPSWG